MKMILSSSVDINAKDYVSGTRLICCSQSQPRLSGVQGYLIWPGDGWMNGTGDEMYMGIEPRSPVG